MLVRTLKRCSGRFNFAPGIELEIPSEHVADLVAADAVELLEAIRPVQKARQPEPEPISEPETEPETEPQRKRGRPKKGT